RADMLETSVGTGPKDDPAEVALEGFQAMMSGRDHVVPGPFRNKARVAAARILPDTVTAGRDRTVSEPGSASQV
ncbi:MAG: SDR family NAD(P)-dependent oxidoreductase, partial [Pseudonocardiaceae bacterium]